MNLPQFGNEDITTASVTYTVNNQDHTMIIASVYVAIEDQEPPPLMEKLVQHCTNNHIPLVLACDTNAHHPAWGSVDYNHRGIILSEYIATTNLEVANCGTEPTFCAGNKRTIIDVTLVDKVLYRDIRTSVACLA